MLRDMAKAATNGPYKWIAAALLSILLLAAGAFVGDIVSRASQEQIREDLAEHASEEGHPVIVERVGTLSQDIQDMRAEMRMWFDRLEQKIDAQSNKEGGETGNGDFQESH